MLRTCTATFHCRESVHCLKQIMTLCIFLFTQLILQGKTAMNHTQNVVHPKHVYVHVIILKVLILKS